MTKYNPKSDSKSDLRNSKLRILKDLLQQIEGSKLSAEPSKLCTETLIGIKILLDEFDELKTNEDRAKKEASLANEKLALIQGIFGAIVAKGGIDNILKKKSRYSSLQKN